ncbi:MAG: hypothetical protein JST28_13660 [Acidobacteria bacterium]|nr:hypothetical protein [Acidobacteriota bacterium]
MPFPHRINSDGTIDSICDQCFITVATSTHESDLAHLEAEHTCEPARFDYYHHESIASKRPPTSDRDHQSARRPHTATTRH